MLPSLDVKSISETAKKGMIHVMFPDRQGSAQSKFIKKQKTKTKTHQPTINKFSN